MMRPTVPDVNNLLEIYSQLDPSYLTDSDKATYRLIQTLRQYLLKIPRFSYVDLTNILAWFDTFEEVPKKYERTYKMISDLKEMIEAKNAQKVRRIESEAKANLCD